MYNWALSYVRRIAAWLLWVIWRELPAPLLRLDEIIFEQEIPPMITEVVTPGPKPTRTFIRMGVPEFFRGGNSAGERGRIL